MTPKHIPGTAKPKWISKKWLVELLAGIPPFGLALVGGIRLVQDPATERLGNWSLGLALLLLIAFIVKIAHARYLDKETAAKLDHDGLRGAIFVLHAAACELCGIDPNEANDDLRVTFHRVVPPLNEPLEIEQIVPYVGGKGGGSGRKNSVRAGLTGRCIRMKEPLTMHRETVDEARYRAELAADWGYTEAEARAVMPDRMSFMAVPVLDRSKQHALGVIYIDAKRQNSFVDAAVRSSLIQACGGVTRYVSERY